MRRQYVLTLLVACGGGSGSSSGDDQSPTDAKHLDAAIDITELSGDFSCSATPWPTTAPDPLSLVARVKDPLDATNVGNANVEIRRRADDSLVVMGTSTSPQGIYAFNVATAGTPPVIYRKATISGRLDGYTYDPYPPFDTNHPQRHVYAPTPASRDALYAAAGVTPDPAKSTVMVEVFDCLDLQVYGATIDAPGAEKVVYLDDNGTPNSAQPSTGSPGIALVLNAPTGEATITVHAGSVVYRAVPVTNRANSFVYSPRLP